MTPESRHPPFMGTRPNSYFGGPSDAATIRSLPRLGAKWQTSDALRKGAELAVAAITERVRIANQSGGMKLINRKYRAYRQQQLAKGEKATSYAAFIEPFVATMVKQVAMTGRIAL